MASRERLLRRAGVPRTVLWPAGMPVGPRGTLHATRTCREYKRTRAWRKKSILTACQCANNKEAAPGWGTILDLRVVALLAEATAQARRSGGIVQRMGRLLHLQERLRYGEGVVRVSVRTSVRVAPHLAAVARKVCREGEKALDAAYERIRNEVGRREVQERFGGDTRLFEVVHLSGVTRSPYLALHDPAAALILETYTIGKRPGAVLVAAPAEAQRVVEIAAARYTIGATENHPAYQVNQLGAVPREVQETLATLYEETETGAAELLETAELLVQPYLAPDDGRPLRDAGAVR